MQVCIRRTESLYPVIGLPKPAIINQVKGIRQTHGYKTIDFTHQDVTYVVTPLYHSAATCVGVFNTIGEGIIVIALIIFPLDSVHQFLFHRFITSLY